MTFHPVSLYLTSNLIPQKVSNRKEVVQVCTNEIRANEDPRSSSASASHTFLQPLLFSLTRLEVNRRGSAVSCS